MSADILKLATHDGRFHADDVFAFTIFRIVSSSLSLIRSRDASVWDEADIVFDVGGEYDPENGRYDHHMENPPTRDDGNPYSSAGLIWKKFGRSAVKLLIENRDAHDWVVFEIDRGLILDLDKADNQVGETRGAGYISALVEAFNPQWNENASFDDRFSEASHFARGILERSCRQALAEYEAIEYVRSALASSEDKRLIVLDKDVNWQKAIFHLEATDTKYVVHPDEQGGRWLSHAVPIEFASFDVRKQFPEKWAGLEGEELSQLAKVSDAIFCHPRRFVCAAQSKDSAIKMSDFALQN